VSGENELRPSSWTVDTLREYFQQQLIDNRVMLDERYATQVKAVDAAFIAQQCVSADTVILCADLVWRPAGDLLPGDELIGFNEQTGIGSGNARKFERSTVIANTLQRDALLRVNTINGSVRCNYEHPWLARPRRTSHHTPWRWIEAQALKPGDEVLHVFDPWDVERSWEGGWLAGMLDGEGCICFKRSPTGNARLSVSQRVSPTADLLESALKERTSAIICTDRVAGYHGYANRKASRIFEISVQAEILRILGSVRPARLLEVSDQVWEGKRLVGGRASRATVVTSIDPAGTGMIASLSTTTRTYIAAGFAMHNTALASSLQAAEKAVAVALLAAEKATIKAETAADKRFESVNEFRSQLSDQASTFMPRAEAEVSLTRSSERIQELTADLARLVSREEMKAATDRNTERIQELTDRMNRNEGHGAGLSTGWVYLLGAIAALGAIATMYLAFHH